MKKTLKELADELGVSKDKVKYQARKLPPHYMEKDGNITYLNDLGIAEIKKQLSKASEQPAPEAPKQQADPLVEMLQSTLAMLQRQLSEKDAQIAAKDAQIAALTETVKSQAQSINADRHNELAGTLQHQLTDGSTANHRKGFWEWLGRKKGE